MISQACSLRLSAFKSSPTSMSTSRTAHVWKVEKRETTASRVERQIKTAVLEDVFAFGEFLGSETELASRFDVSRLPIREAVGRLGSLGVVEVRTGAGGGVRIAEGDPRPAVEALAIQMALVGTSTQEILSAWRCMQSAVLVQTAAHAQDEDYRSIEAAIAHAESVRNDQSAFSEAALACNQAEVDAAHNHVLSITMSAIFYSLSPKVRKITTPAATEIVLGHHRAMLEVLRRRDGEKAQALFEKHFVKVWDAAILGVKA